MANDTSLTNQTETGITLLAPTNLAFQKLGKKLQDPKEVLLYHILERTLSAEDVEATVSRQLLVRTSHPHTQMLVTLNEDDRLTFNGVACKHEILELDPPGEADSDSLATRGVAQVENGILCPVETVLHPPTIIQFLQITSQYTDRDTSILNELLDASISNDPTFWENIAAEGRVTLFAPLDTFEFLHSIKLRNRLMSAKWLPHLLHFLSCIIVGQALSVEDLEELVSPNSTGMIASVGGKNITIDVNSIRGTSIDGHAIQDPSISATDGIIHFVNFIELPEWVTNSVYDIIESNAKASKLPEILQSAALREPLSKAAPITFFAPPNSLLENVSAAEAADAIESHIFDDLYCTEQLLDMDGQIIKSRNNKNWVVSVLDGSIFLEAEDNGAIVGQVQSKFQSLASNGVIHGIDALLFIPVSDGTLVPLVLSFIISNVHGLTSTEISSFNAPVLIEAFTIFLENIVAFVEQKQQQDGRKLWPSRSTHRHHRRRRRLDTMLHPDSVRIYGLQDIACPTTTTTTTTNHDNGNNNNPPPPTIPADGSNCQRVFTSFVLATSDSNTKEVESRYSAEVISAYKEGKLQESLLLVDPSTPIQVVIESGDNDNDNERATKDSDHDDDDDDDKELEWWKSALYVVLCILILVLVCVICYCGLLRGVF